MGLCGSTQASCVVAALDQSNVTTGGTRLATTIGQTFTAGITGQLTGIDLQVESGTSSGAVTVTNEAGTVVLRSDAFAITQVGANRVDFTGPVPVVAGTVYRFQVSLASEVRVRQSVDTYPGGSVAGATDRDLGFATYVAPCP